MALPLTADATEHYDWPQKYNPSSSKLGIDTTIPNTSLKTFTVADLTNGKVTGDKEKENLAWSGKAILDELIHVMDENLKIQIDKGNIPREEYAKAYYTMFPQLVQSAINFLQLQQNQDIQLYQVARQIALQVAQAEAQLASQKEQFAKQYEIELKKLEDENDLNKLREEKSISEIKLTERQVLGFDDNLLQKMLEYQLNAFSTIFASGMLDSIDTGPLNVSKLNESYNDLRKRATSDKSSIDTTKSRIKKAKSTIDI